MSHVSASSSIGKLGSVFAAGLLALSSGAHALTLTVTDLAPSNTSLSISFNGGTSTYYTVNAGNLNGYDGTSNFTVYCIDPLTTAQTPSSYTAASLDQYLPGAPASPNGKDYTTQFAQSQYTTVAGYTIAGGAAAYNDQTNAVLTQRITDLYKYAYADATTADKQAAFQYALWEALGESTAGLGDAVGAMRITGGTGNTASFQTAVDLYLNGMATGNWGSLTAAANGYTFTVFIPDTQGGSQAFIRAIPGSGGGTSLPVPATAALVLLGLAGAAAMRKRTAN